MRHFRRYFGISLAALALPGCQGVSQLFASSHPDPAVGVDMTSYFDQLISEGRGHLQKNRPGAAIRVFRQASHNPEYSGSAYNGMAVAYDMLGRYDLAEQFFRLAVEAAPEDERFARNLARFDTLMLARGRAPAQLADNDVDADSVERQSLGEDPVSITQVRVAFTGPANRLERVSPSTVHIGPRADRVENQTQGHASPQLQVAHRVTVTASGMLHERKPVSREQVYPVQFSLADVSRSADISSNGSETAARAGFRSDDGRVSVRVTSDSPMNGARHAYPVRIALPSS